MALPKELEGKSAEEIAAHYESKLTEQKDFFNNALEQFGTPPAQPVVPAKTDEVKPPSTGEFLANPTEETRKMIQQHGVPREEWTRMTVVAQQSFIYTAKQMAMESLRAEAEKAGDTFDWDRVRPLLDKMAEKTEPLSLTNPATWTAMYYYNRGTIANSLRKEAVAKATAPAESSTPGSGYVPPAKELTFEEEPVAVGMGITAETYREAQTNMRTGRLPLTYDNRKARR